MLSKAGGAVAAAFPAATAATPTVSMTKVFQHPPTFPTAPKPYVETSRRSQGRHVQQGKGRLMTTAKYLRHSRTAAPK
ncbi:hypothetical protein, partial [Pseudarthrobacter equi]|uniref:hypothetical protein n=1 Tax=Pseudarthrobacter equi TaxID=728066 RepID=UPI0021C20FAD